jgi:Uma2 family endonuclease
MSMAVEKRRVTLQEYVQLEEQSPAKSEFYRGEIFAMAGASPRHDQITVNILGNLYRLLEGQPCQPTSSDQRIRVDEADLSTYPDVAVVCGEKRFSKTDRYGMVNPRVVFEVLSPATENYDRGPKFELYQRLESLREYVVVSQDEAKIIHYARQSDDTWSYRLLVGRVAILSLESIGCPLPLDAIYRKVDFGPQPETTTKT